MSTLYRTGSVFLAVGLFGLVLLTAHWVLSAAEPGSAKPAAKKSLDEELLDDLDAGLSPETPADKRATPDKAARPSNRPSEDSGKTSDGDRGDALDDALLKGLDEGEDVSLEGRTTDENPIARLNERMREVQGRIAKSQSGEKTQRLQREISDELAKLIDQVERQASKLGQSSSASSGSSRSQARQPGQSSKAGEPSSEKSARDSSERMRKEKTVKVDAEYQDLLKDVWGHLPPHLRQQMEQSANEEFLPKYESEISEYFRALNKSGKRR